MPELHNQNLARYAFERSKVKGDRVRDGLFKPKAGEDLSVYDIEGFSQQQACDHGRTHADNAMLNRSHIGYACFNYHIVVELELQAIYDEPETNHVSITFPNDPATSREKAKALASNSKFYPCP